jgi:hypothetical protein
MTVDLVERILWFLWTRDSATVEEIARHTDTDDETVAQALSMFVDVYEPADVGGERWRTHQTLRPTTGEIPKNKVIDARTLMKLAGVAQREVDRLCTCRACGKLCLNSPDSNGLCLTCNEIRRARFEPADVKLPTAKDFGIVDAD